MRRAAVALLLLGITLAALSSGQAAHRPLYKAGYDVIPEDAWEAHFVWLRSDYFNFVGQVWWQVYVQTGGEVDILFFDLEGFARFRDGLLASPLIPPQTAAPSGSQWISQLTGDLPYFLVLRNDGPAGAEVEWTIYAEVDWRRWQGQPPGPTLELRIVERSPPLYRNDSWERTFDEPAVFVYNCQPHLDMTAILEVVDSGEPAGLVDVEIRDMGFHPEAIRVPIGTTVRWTNWDGLDHSVELRALDGGFQVPPRPFEMPLWGFAGIAAAAAVAGILHLFRRKRGGPEGTSKSSGESRTDDTLRVKDK